MYLRFPKIKNSIKNIGKHTKKVPTLHKFLSKSYNFYIIYLLPFLNLHKRILKLKKNNILKILGLQSIKVIKIKNIDLKDRKSLINSLKNIQFKEGGWCIYYENAFKIIDKKFFPESYKNLNIGLKILINNKEIKDKNKKDIYGLRPFGKYANVKEVLRVGNRMSILNIGPRIYDLICIEDKNGISAFAYLLENIESKGNQKLNNPETKLFLKQISKDKWLKPTWSTIHLIDDFDLEKDNPNIIINNKNEFKFIDFQAFSIPEENKYIQNIVEDFAVTSFGKKRIFSDKNYLYQVLPEIKGGKRDTLKRWNTFDMMFENINFSLEDKIILDIGCNIGMNCYYSLSRGSKFAYGIDKKNVAEKARLILNALGLTRLNILGLDLNSEVELNKINKIIKDEIDILFYCSIDGHIGYPIQIKDLRFKYILHEGHPNSSLENNINNLYINNWLDKNNSKILFKSYITDGDSPSRPLLLALR
ncbi:hypothetical protein OA189_01745 [Prochlorococcus sp. AH-716-P20]|nr:hypothetical protein [Prochlorococcus sp. AH-716-P20]